MANLSGTKSALSSITVWGAIAALLSSFMPVLFTWLGTDPNTAAQWVVGIIAFGVTVYGRITATKQVTITGAPTTPVAQPE